MTLQGDPNVADGTNRRRVGDFLLILNSNFDPILPRFSESFCTHSCSGQNFECYHSSRSMMLGCAEREHPKLTNHEIIFEECQPM